MSNETNEINKINKIIKNPIKKIHTSCHDCCFAVYDGINSATQVDCVLNLIEHYRNKKQEILEAYNEDNEFYIINGRKCYYKRTKDWYEKLNLAEEKDYIDRVWKETQIKYTAIIYANDDYYDVNLTLKSILCQEHLPAQIVIIRGYGNKIKPSDLNDLLIKTGIKWRVSNAQSQDITQEIVFRGLIDIFYQKYPVYLKIDAGKMICDDDLMKKINTKIILDGNKIGLLTDEDLVIGNSYLNKFFRGSFPEECQAHLSTFLNE
jgi:hypothetical protein